MTEERLQRGFAGVAVLVIALLLLALWKQHDRIRDMIATRAQYETAARQVYTINRLVGRPAPEIALQDPAGVPRWLPAETKGAVVWMIDVPRCRGCLSDIAAWNGMAAPRSSPGLVVLMNVDSAEAQRLIAGAGLRGRILIDSTGELQRHFDLALPSAYAATDADGVIRMADARQAEQSCDWRFAEQALALSAGVGLARSPGREFGAVAAEL